MKKLILKITFIAAVAVASAYTAYSQSQKTEVLSGLTLQNVEALANGGEFGGGFIKTTGNCSDPVAYKKWVSCQPGGTEECYSSDC